MFDIQFNYFDGKNYMFKNIDTVKYIKGAEFVTLTGKDLLNTCIPLYFDLYLFGANSSYTVSHQNLASIVVVKSS